MGWPTTDDPRTEFVTVRLTKGEAAVLDAYAKDKTFSRSAAVRDSVIRVINAEHKRQAKNRGRKT